MCLQNPHETKSARTLCNPEKLECPYGFFLVVA